MLNLKDLVKYKSIVVNGKDIKIPRLSLYHYNAIEGIKEPDAIINNIVATIHKGLSRAERDIVLLHLLEFNGRLKSEVEYKGHVYKLGDVYTKQKLKYKIGDIEYRFRTPKTSELNVPEDTLNKCFVEAKQNGKVIELGDIDFYDFPAYVKDWLDGILTTIAIDGQESFNGMGDILELFEYESKL